jgi:hypothetical protein
LSIATFQLVSQQILTHFVPSFVMLESCSLLFLLKKRLLTNPYMMAKQIQSILNVPECSYNITMRRRVGNQNIDHINGALDFLQKVLGDEMTAFKNVPPSWGHMA